MPASCGVCVRVRVCVRVLCVCVCVCVQCSELERMEEIIAVIVIFLNLI
jgi:hypothetical protein